ncbi:MAG: hypothetical protein ACJ77K_06475 [Bacteroidia bacterium]
MTKQNTVSAGFEVKAYTKKELRLMYGLAEGSFRKWLKELPETKDTGRKNWLTALQVEAILKKYGVPRVNLITMEVG